MARDTLPATSAPGPAGPAVISRRGFLSAIGLAALATTLPPATRTPEPCCLTAEHEPHAFTCPVALARLCDDCGAEPGEMCDFDCSAFWD